MMWERCGKDAGITSNENIERPYHQQMRFLIQPVEI